MVAVMSHEHPLAGTPFVRLADFRREKLITYVAREDSHFVTRVLEPAGVIPRAIEPVQLTEAIIEMVRAGLGIAVLARWAVAPYLHDSSLRAVKVTAEGLRREWKAGDPEAARRRRLHRRLYPPRHEAHARADGPADLSLQPPRRPRHWIVFRASRARPGCE